MISCQRSSTSLTLVKKRWPAEVEAVAVADRGLGDAADLVLGLEHDHGQPLLGEQVAGGQPGRAASEDHGRLVAHVGARELGGGLRLQSLFSLIRLRSSRRRRRGLRCGWRGGSSGARLQLARGVDPGRAPRPTERTGVCTSSVQGASQSSARCVTGWTMRTRPPTGRLSTSGSRFFATVASSMRSPPSVQSITRSFSTGPSGLANRRSGASAERLEVVGEQRPLLGLHRDHEVVLAQQVVVHDGLAQVGRVRLVLEAVRARDRPDAEDDQRAPRARATPARESPSAAISSIGPSSTPR